MEVYAYCRKCNKGYDAHWSKMKGGPAYYLNPECIYCGALGRENITVTTDEHYDDNPLDDCEEDL